MTNGLHKSSARCSRGDGLFCGTTATYRVRFSSDLIGRGRYRTKRTNAIQNTAQNSAQNKTAHFSIGRS